jgi:UDP-N-acetylglucosamine--N-acetylmuramyl-(pentapeptide) pyrophosphoryl-undecaprenol N-acetylglucosamine transferase
MERKRLILSAGGTGGHLFPALALANQLDEFELIFIAGGLSSSPFFKQTAFGYREIATAPLSLKKPLSLCHNGWRIGKGVHQSRKFLKELSPAAVIGFGSYHTFPLLLAAQIEKIPIFLHEQNVFPGRVTRLFSRWAKFTATTFCETAEFLKGSCWPVTFPGAKGAKEGSAAEAYAYFELTPAKPTLLIYGGSKGAHFLNELLIAALNFTPLPFQILHFTGTRGEVEKIKRAYTLRNVAHSVKPFETQMHRALQIADLAIARAGAGTLIDLIEWEVPALLIPYPWASEAHQQRNGEYFEKIVKGGSMFQQERATPQMIASRLLNFSKKELDEKRKNIQEYKQKRETKEFIELIREYLDAKGN